MQSDFSSSLARVLVYEGGKVDDPRDPGGRTNEGVTQATFNAYLRENKLPAADVYNIAPAQVSAIYQSAYWGVIKGDALPAGVDFCVFDAAVNSGPGHAGIWLQQALGAAYKGRVDGLIGAQTLQAVTDFGDFGELISVYCALRLGTLQKLSTWRTFGKGWGARIANVQKLASAMAASETVPNPVDVTYLGGHHKAPVVIPQSNATKVITGTTAAASGTGIAASQVLDQLSPIQAQFPHWHWVTAVIGALGAVAALAGVVAHLGDVAKKAAAAGARQAMVDIDADQGLPQIPIKSV